MADVSVREALTQAIRYWEPGRLLYDAAFDCGCCGLRAGTSDFSEPTQRESVAVLVPHGCAGECGLLRLLYSRCRGAGVGLSSHLAAISLDIVCCWRGVCGRADLLFCHGDIYFA
jgi:hypothetical protein